MAITRWDVVAYPELGTKWHSVYHIEDGIELEFGLMPTLEDWTVLNRRVLSEEFGYS